MSGTARQLPLPFVQPPGYAAADFIAAASNAEARDWLAQPGSWPNGRLLLWGEPGCGKTHLLHIWAAAQRATLRDGATLRGLPAPPTAPLAIDDADAADALALLHLLNMAAEARLPVLLAARQPPNRQAWALPDLASRLRAAQAVEIRPPDDDLLAALLAQLAAGRQLLLSPPVQNYLLARLPRTPAALREAVARLDRAGLDRQARITRALAAAVLDDMLLTDAPVTYPPVT